LAIVWPCQMSVETYAAACREVVVTRPDCPSCDRPMVRWSGYFRTVRFETSDLRVFITRWRCRSCAVTHALLPAFCLSRRLHSSDVIGEVISEVADGSGGVRPAARRRDVVFETARGWVRRFRARAGEIAAGFAALCVELGGEVVTPVTDVSRYALAAIRASFEAARALPGWAALPLWHFVAAVTGGRIVATNTNSPYLVVGRRRFMPPVPNNDNENGGERGP